MIETKEDYQQLNGMLADTIDEIDHSALVDTFEALRRFVRAHDALDGARIGVGESLSREEYNALVYEFKDARDALPDWLTDG